MTKRTVLALLLCVLPLPSMAVERGHAPVNGLKLYYEVHGPKPAAGEVPLLLLHGGGSSLRSSFGTLLPHLSKTRRVIVYDQQGHGRTTDVDDRPFTFEQSARDAVALLRHLGISRADFMGYSNGGQIALEVALTHPELVRRLIFQSAMTSRDGLPPEVWKGFENPRIEDMPEALKQEYRATSPHPEKLPSFFAKSARRMKEFRGWTPEQVRSVRVPVLILLGDRDIRVEHGAELLRLFPDAQLAVLPGTDHGQMTERGAQVAPIVLEFLRAERTTPSKP